MAGFESDFGANSAASNEIVLEADFFEQDDSYKPQIPEGRWLAKVDSVSMYQKPGSNSVSMKWGVTFIEGPAAGKSKDHYTYVGKKVNGRLTEAEGGKTARQFLRAIGITPELTPEAFENGRMRLKPDTVINRTFYATVTHKSEPNKNNPQETVTFANIVKVEPNEPVGEVFTGTVTPAGGIPQTF